MSTTRRRFLGWLGLGAVAAPALPAAIEKLSEQKPFAWESFSGSFEAPAVVEVGSVVRGAITGVNILSAGSGYTSSPVITFTGQGATSKVTIE